MLHIMVKGNSERRVGDEQLAALTAQGWKEYDPATGQPVVKAAAPTLDPNVISQRLETATAENERLVERNDQLLEERDALTKERDTAIEERDALAEERDALTAKVAELEEALAKAKSKAKTETAGK